MKIWKETHCQLTGKSMVTFLQHIFRSWPNVVRPRKFWLLSLTQTETTKQRPHVNQAKKKYSKIRPLVLWAFLTAAYHLTVPCVTSLVKCLAMPEQQNPGYPWPHNRCPQRTSPFFSPPSWAEATSLVRKQAANMHHIRITPRWGVESTFQTAVALLGFLPFLKKRGLETKMIVFAKTGSVLKRVNDLPPPSFGFPLLFKIYPSKWTPGKLESSLGEDCNRRTTKK